MNGFKFEEDEKKTILSTENLIKELQAGEDLKLMIKEIGEKHGIDIKSAEGNSHSGDFSYPKEDEQKLISILDAYLKD